MLRPHATTTTGATYEPPLITYYYLYFRLSHISQRGDTMADNEQPPPLPTPAASTATKAAVDSALDAPDDSSVHVDSPLPPNPLFRRLVPCPPMILY